MKDDEDESDRKRAMGRTYRMIYLENREKPRGRDQDVSSVVRVHDQSFCWRASLQGTGTGSTMTGDFGIGEKRG